jgi:hypothetical protein
MLEERRPQQECAVEEAWAMSVTAGSELLTVEKAVVVRLTFRALVVW